MTNPFPRTSIKGDQLDAFKQELVSAFADIEPRTKQERMILLDMIQCWTETATLAHLKEQSLSYEALDFFLDKDREMARYKIRAGFEAPGMKEGDMLSALGEYYTILDTKLRSCYTKHATVDTPQTKRYLGLAS
jgi:hypothetical protein